MHNMGACHVSFSPAVLRYNLGHKCSTQFDKFHTEICVHHEIISTVKILSSSLTPKILPRPFSTSHPLPLVPSSITNDFHSITIR